MLVPQGTQNHRPVKIGEAGFTVADQGLVQLWSRVERLRAVISELDPANVPENSLGPTSFLRV